jgi:hypothetical protein
MIPPKPYTARDLRAAARVVREVMASVPGTSIAEACDRVADYLNNVADVLAPPKKPKP